MRLPSAAQALLLLALTAVCFVAEAQSRQRITVRTYRTNYMVDSWEDGRDEPYRVTYWKLGVKSVYTFDVSGHVKTLTARDTMYTFDLAAPSRMLLDSDDDLLQDVDVDLGSLISCADCEVSFAALCDVGLPEVCVLDENNPDEFDEDAQDSVRRLCSAFGAACEVSAADLCDEGECVEGPTGEPVEPSTSAPTAATVEPTPAPTLEPASSSSAVALSACNPSPCENGGSCSIDPAGGHVCSCANGYGGMACQTDTSGLASFFMEIDFIGKWTDAHRAVFQSAADWWSELITHVPCGGAAEFPSGRLLITATLEAIDGAGSTIGSAGPTSVWNACNTISAEGTMRFDIDDIANLEADGTFQEVVLLKTGYVIGMETLWGDGFGECTTYRETGDPAWTCPAAVSAYADIFGPDADVVESGGDSDFSDDGLTTAVGDKPTYLSKMTAAILDDLNYVVDPSKVDAFILPAESALQWWRWVGGPCRSCNADDGDAGIVSTSIIPSDSQTNGEPGPSVVNDIGVDAIILLLDDEGDVVDERVGVNMQF